MGETPAERRTRRPATEPELNELQKAVDRLETALIFVIDGWAASLTDHERVEWRRLTGQGPGIWFHDRYADAGVDAFNAVEGYKPRGPRLGGNDREKLVNDYVAAHREGNKKRCEELHQVMAPHEAFEARSRLGLD